LTNGHVTVNTLANTHPPTIITFSGNAKLVVDDNRRGLPLAFIVLQRMIGMRKA
jgi:hypothetical protein